MGEEMRSISSSMADGRRFGLSARTDSPYTPHKVDKMRRHLRFHFMTPCEKFKARRRKPWKLAAQLFKILVVTLQVFALGFQRTNFVDYQHKTKTALEHIMFKGWDAAYETMPYPAATGRYALYERLHLTEHIDYAMHKYNQTVTLAIGAYGYPKGQMELKSKTAMLKMVSFKQGEIYANNLTYDLNPKLEEVFLELTSVELANGTEGYDIVKFLHQKGQRLEFHKLQTIELSFALNGIHVKMENSLNPFDDPDCLQMNATVLYDNSLHDGQVTVEMKVAVVATNCHSDSHYDINSTTEFALVLLLDVVVILICALSFLTCVRSLRKSFKLLISSSKFFCKHYDYTLSTDDKMLFVSFWYFMIILADILTITGTGFKLCLTFKMYNYFNEATMCLGIAIVLIWMGVMRYFEYFKKYNVLVMTCKKALPNVIRFMICASIFYVAFTICGWLVLAPYHIKFATIATSSECLFSLVNGDDMFVTFSVIDKNAPIVIWYFSRVYLYCFISLFIYFVLNVFTSVIIDTYDAVKSYYLNDYPKTVIEEFIVDGEDDPTSHLYISDVQHRDCRISCCCLFPCLPRDEMDDTTNIVT